MRRLSVSWGLNNQALDLCSRLPECSERNFYQALCWMKLWNYQEAKNELLLYLNFPKLTPRERITGMINLTACHLTLSENEQARQLIVQIDKLCSDQWVHLQLNLLELKGQLLIADKSYKKAIELLRSAQEMSQNEKSETNLYIRKWQLYALLLSKEINVKDPSVSEFKKECREQYHWENLRDFDKKIARFASDEELLSYVYFGTPYDSFRQSIGGTSLKFYDWGIKGGDSIDLYRKENLPVGFASQQHLLMMILVSDFYTPWSIERIFDHLYPGELFDPLFSSKKVYRLIENVQKTLKESLIPLELSSTSKGYRLRARKGHSIRIHPRMIFSNSENFIFYIIKSHGFAESFSSTELDSILPLSRHQWYRHLKKLEEQGLIASHKKGRSTQYNIKKAV